MISILSPPIVAGSQRTTLVPGTLAGLQSLEGGVLAEHGGARHRVNMTSLTVAGVHYGRYKSKLYLSTPYLPMESSLCVARSLQSVVQTPPDTREEERERTRENNKDDLTMVRLSVSVCLSRYKNIHIST